MRRKDREILDYEEILNIMKKCDACTVAFFDEKYPYIVPLNFGVQLENNKFILYFHGANAGKKVELREKNRHVSFEMHCSTKLLPGELACNFTMEYESVCGNGTLEMVDNEEKIAAFQVLMKQYDSQKEYEFDEKMVNAVAVMKLSVNEITGKRLKK
jgi:nitroimidazol reductase NimA-like FMN-containing flavoprotein (pyridoxamine 5'-phosphate oxidase superfamily)